MPAVRVDRCHSTRGRFKAILVIIIVIINIIITIIIIITSARGMFKAFLDPLAP